MRPPTAKLTFNRSCSDRNAPETRSDRFLVARLNRPTWPNDILGLQSTDQRRTVDAEIGEFLHGELDEDLLVLRAEDFDLGHVLHVQEFRADVFYVVAKLAMAETIRREAVNDAERITELVVETRSDHAIRQRMAHIADDLTDVIPDIRHLLAVVSPFRLTKIVVTPALVKLRKKSRCGVSCSVRSTVP